MKQRVAWRCERIDPAIGDGKSQCLHPCSSRLGKGGEDQIIIEVGSDGRSLDRMTKNDKKTKSPCIHTEIMTSTPFFRV